MYKNPYEDEILDHKRQERILEIAKMLLKVLNSLPDDNATKYFALFKAFYLFSYPVFGESNE